MKCKCGNDAEYLQLNIRLKTERLCADCFNRLGEPIAEAPPEPPEPSEVFLGSQMDIDEVLQGDKR